MKHYRVEVIIRDSEANDEEYMAMSSTPFPTEDQAWDVFMKLGKITGKAFDKNQK